MRAAAFRPLAFLCALTMHGGCTHGRGSAALGATPNGMLAIAQHVDYLDVLGREPMVVEHPDGSLFVAGYGEPRPTLWKSHDRGVTWTRVDVGSEAHGAIGNSDVDIAVSRDGTLYFVSMLYDRAANEVGRSRLALAATPVRRGHGPPCRRCASMIARGWQWRRMAWHM